MSAKLRISQTDLPRESLERALRLPRALIDEFAGEGTPPVDLALAVGVKPSSSGWRALTGAAIGYGLTVGGYNTSLISLTTLGRRAVAPQEEGEANEALREACLKPTVIGGFLKKYDGSKFPRKEIGQNVLSGQFSVPVARTDEALTIIEQNAEMIHALRSRGVDSYVSLSGVGSKGTVNGGIAKEAKTETPEIGPDEILRDAREAEAPGTQSERPVTAIFVGHSRATKVLNQVKQLLELADLRAEVATEQETAAIPVPDKVFDAMSQSDAAIICVTADAGREGEEGYEVNANVLIEIGAAYVRHNKRLVLLWDRRVVVPSNLQGLYRCEFEGDELSWEAGTRLQKALIRIKKGQAPS